MDNNITELFTLPVTNFETRIVGLQQDLQERVKASSNFIKNIEWEKSRLDSEINEFKGYFNNNNNTPFLLKRVELEQAINLEKINCLRDVFMIKEKIRYAKERLLTERYKQKLLHGRSKRTA